MQWRLHRLVALFVGWAMSCCLVSAAPAGAAPPRPAAITGVRLSPSEPIGASEGLALYSTIGLEIRYEVDASSTPGACAIGVLGPRLLSYLGLGTCVIVAREVDSGGNPVGDPLVQSVTVTKALQIINVVGPTTGTLGSAVTFTVTPGGSSAPLQMSLGEWGTPGACRLDGEVVSLLAVGACYVVWRQDGDATHLDGFAMAAVAVTKLPQSIAPNLPPTPVVRTAVPFRPTGGGSGNPVVATVIPFGVCELDGAHTTLTFTLPGQCLIYMSQAGNDVYAEVPQFTVSLDVQPGAGAVLAPSSPVRMIDTRGGSGGPYPIEPGETSPYFYNQSPYGSLGEIVNITVVDPLANGWLKAWPCGQPEPAASSINFQGGAGGWPGQVSVGRGDGRLCVRSSAEANLVIDLVGWLAPAIGGGYVPVPPTRVVDTRELLGGVRLGARSVLRVDPSTTPGWPRDATSAVVQLTAVGGSGPGFLTTFPCDQPIPETSAVNVRGTGRDASSSLVTTALAGDGSFCVYTYADTDVVVDVNGAWAPSSPILFAPAAAPERAVDTRIGVGGTRLGAGGVLRLPSSAWGGGSAVFLNVVAVNAAAAGYLTLYDCAGSRPTVSNLNYPAAGAAPDGYPTSNAAQVQVAAGHDLCVFSMSPTDVIVDISGHTTA